MDYDPDGINIMRCYKYGSHNLEHEENTVVPGLRWLGMKSRHMLQACTVPDVTNRAPVIPRVSSIFPNSIALEDRNIPFTSQELHGSTSSQLTTLASRRAPISPLTARDRKCALETLLRLNSSEEGETDIGEIRRETQVMLMLNYKAEIQAVDNLGDLTDWLDEHLPLL
jgi:meiotic recombination protein SPO11